MYRVHNKQYIETARQVNQSSNNSGQNKFARNRSIKDNNNH